MNQLSRILLISLFLTFLILIVLLAWKIFGTSTLSYGSSMFSIYHRDRHGYMMINW